MLKSSLIIRSGPFPKLCDTQKRDAQKCKLPMHLTKEEIWWPFELWGENPDRGPTEELPVLGGGNISGLSRLMQLI